ncbi:MAG TPA: CBS domain-containing protein [Polyangiaceae bacterium]|nr:CBS domain-containing protein [Polyangiaceae bacterium]
MVSVGKHATVFDAVRAMVEARVGATVVLEEGKLIGVFTERDVCTRVVVKGLDPAKTEIAEVMTRSVVTVREDADRSSVLELMAKHHIRHLPVVDDAGRVLTMLSMRHLLRAEVQDLRQTVWELVAENQIDAPGG